MNRIIPKKRWGQNFLIDPNICKKIVSSIETKNIDKILEIGSGTGAITSLLAEKFKEVTAIEIDSNLCSFGPSVSNLEFNAVKTAFLSFFVISGIINGTFIDPSPNASFVLFFI